MKSTKENNQDSNINLRDFFVSSLKTLFSYVYSSSPTQNSRKMAAVHLLGIAEVVVKTLTPILIINGLNITRPNDQSIISISNETLMLGFVSLASTFILPRIRHSLIGAVRRDVQQQITMDMVRRVYEGPLDEHMAEPTGDLVATVSKNYSDIEKVMPITEELFNISIEVLLKSAILFSYVGLVGMTPAMVFVPYLLAAFGGEIYAGLLKLGNSQVMVKTFDRLLETVNNYTVAQQNGNSELELSKLRHQISELGKSFAKVNKVEENNSLMLSMINSLGFLSACAYVFLKPPTADFWVSKDMMIFAYYMLTTSLTLGNLPGKINSLLNGIAGAFLVDKFFKTHPVIKDPDNAVDFELKSAPKIEFKNVNFSYNDKPSLKNISFAVEPGQTIVIMGPTGCGKSTLLKLFQRLYDNFTGEILVNGVNIKNIKPAQLRRPISVIAQDTNLMNDTLFENIKYSDPSANEEDVLEAAQYAKLTLSRDRLFSQVEKGGSNFSGGEKQRALIARALVKGGGGFILLGDEITSALDQETSRDIFQVIEQLGNVTKIIVTHDPNMVLIADRIICMEAGQINQIGTFEELISDRNGSFYNLYKAMCEKLGASFQTAIKQKEEYDRKKHGNNPTKLTNWANRRRYSYLFQPANAFNVRISQQPIPTSTVEETLKMS